VSKPKLREVFAADFRDRVVHHVLMDFLEKIWEPVFIHDSYACRKGKGVHAAVERLQSFTRRVSRLCCSMWRQFPLLSECLTLDPVLMWASPRWSRRRDFRRMAQQFGYFRARFPADVVFMQVGAFCEFSSPRKAISPGAGLDLQALGPTRRRARHGFPLRQWRGRLRRVLMDGRSVVLVAESADSVGRRRERLPMARWVTKAPNGIPIRFPEPFQGGLLQCRNGVPGEPKWRVRIQALARNPE
jgi:hypothetical protein